MKSLFAQDHVLANTLFQLHILENGRPIASQPRFEEQLRRVGVNSLRAYHPEILQINLGKICNQTCVHCHVDAAPDRKETMRKETAGLCMEALENTPSLHTVDLTGGAPEMHPVFQSLVERVAALKRKIIVRSNLTILSSNVKFRRYPRFFADHGAAVVASLPCYTSENTDRQRGEGVFEKSIEALQMLNACGYGKAGSGLELNLVYNPGGAVLPPPQDQLEADYKRILFEQFGIIFNRLFTISNMPISRFLDYLLQTGKYEAYMEKLVLAFNPAAAEGVMCRNTISVGWDGQLYDCDFNQMLDLPVRPARHIRDFNSVPLTDREIVVGQHCYGCTAGAGSSCQGALV